MKYFLVPTMIATVAALGLLQKVPATAAGLPVLSNSADDGETSHGIGRRSHSWWHSRTGTGHFCGSGHTKHLDGMGELVEGLFGFTSEQSEAWRRLMTALREGRNSVETSCSAFSDQAGTRSAPAQLAAVEAAMASEIDAFKTVRPAFDSFYALLSERQRLPVDNLFARYGRH